MSTDKVKNEEDRLVVLNRVARSIVEISRGMHLDAAFIVKQLPLLWLRWLVVLVILYAAAAMLRAASEKAATDPLSRDAVQRSE